MAVRFGGDCTKSALENRFRRIKTDAKLINDAVKKGIDPMSLDIGGTDGENAVTSGRRVFPNSPQHLTRFPIVSLKAHSSQST